MKTLKFSLFALVAITTVVVVAAITIHRNQPPVPATAAAQRYDVRGQIRGFQEDGKTIRIAHDEIPGYMEAMVMALEVRPASLLKGFKAGDEVAFELTVADDDSWISRLTKISEGAVAVDVEAASAALKETQRVQAGETVPDFNLLDQHGQPFRLADHRSKAVLVTFIYTRCPLPNFCPLTSKNFASLQERLEKEFSGRFQLVSVTIDPQFDTPEILKEYSTRWSNDEKTWTFATGSPEQVEAVGALFGITVEPMGGLINHDLRTALIGPDGKLVHLWKSNVWTPYEVQRRVRETLAGEQHLVVK